MLQCEMFCGVVGHGCLGGGFFGNVTYGLCKFDEEFIQNLNLLDRKWGGINGLFNARANDCLKNLNLLLIVVKSCFAHFYLIYNDLLQHGSF